MRKTICALAFALVPALLPAQSGAMQPLTLARARALAREASPEVKAAQAALEAALGRERQAGAFPNPVLAYGREQTSRDGLRYSQDVVSLEQQLDVFGAREARRSAAEARRAAAQARLDGTLADLDHVVTRSYAAAVAAERHAVLADEAAGAFSRAVNQSRERLAAGDVSGYQHRRLRLEAARYAGRRMEAQLARDSSYQVLALLVGQDVSGISLTDSLSPSPVEASLDSLVARALLWRPELRAADFEQAAAEADAKAAGAERIPVPVVSAGYKTEHPGVGARLNGFVLGVSLGLPLWDRRAGSVAAARADAARLSASHAVIRRETTRDVRTAYDGLQSLATELEALRAELGEAARRARQAAESAYAEGEINLLEWLDSVRAYYEAETTYFTLWSEYVGRRSALERATGVPLF